jgi:hypothetical protein
LNDVVVRDYVHLEVVEYRQSGVIGLTVSWSKALVVLAVLTRR